MGSLSIWHWLLVILVVVLLFGRGKISSMMGEVASGIKAFQKGLKEEPKDPKTLEAGAPVESRETEKTSKDA